MMFRNTNRIALVGLCCGLSLTLVAGCTGSQTTQAKKTAVPVRIQTISGTRAHYSDLAEMVNGNILPGSDIIVRGVVTKIGPSIEEPAPVTVKEDQADAFREANPGVAYVLVREDISDAELRDIQQKNELDRFINTPVVISVEKVYKGAPDLNQVTVYENGGQVGDRKVVFEDYHPFVLNERVVVLLRTNPTKGEEGTYLVVGADDGIFRVKGDQTENRDSKKNETFSDLEKKLADLISKK